MPKKKDRDGIYTRPDRDGFFTSYTDANGRRRKKKLHAKNLTEARKLRDALIARVERQKILGVTDAEDVAFAEVADKYLRYQKPRVSPKRYERLEGIFRLHLKLAFKGKIGAVTRARIFDYVTDRLNKVSPGSVRQEFLCLKHLLRLAHEEWEMIPNSPAKNITLKTLGVKLRPGRVRYLHPDELLSLLGHCPVWLKPIVVVAVATGLRRGNIVQLRWTQFNEQSRRLIIQKTKNYEQVIIHLNEIALVGLAMAAAHFGRGDIGRVFPGITEINTTVAFGRACKNAGIQDFHFHDLRHTNASWLKMTGSDIHTISLMLGHKDIRQTTIYSQVSGDFLADAARQLDGVFSSLLQLNPAPDRPRDVPGDTVTGGDTR